MRGGGLVSDTGQDFVRWCEMTVVPGTSGAEASGSCITRVIAEGVVEQLDIAEKTTNTKPRYKT